jgi:hypothetical protein
MGKRDDALALLRSGRSPLEIARHQEVSIKTILGYLDELIGRGLVRRSDVYFTMPKEARALARLSGTRANSPVPGLHPDALLVLRHYGDSHNFLLDMYADLAAMEIALHRSIRDQLRRGYGDDWWNRVVPASIREDCAGHGTSSASPERAATLGHLSQIVSAPWEDLKVLFEPSVSGRPIEVTRELRRLGSIRK